MSSVVRPHVPEEELHAYCDGALSPPQRAEIAAHLLACLICRAQQGEVEALRARSSALLAAAAPRTIRPPARRAAPAHRSRRRSLVAAAAVGVLSVGSWLTQGPGDLPTPHLSSAAFVAPAILARVGLREPVLGTGRTSPLAARSTTRARMIPPPAAPDRALHPATETVEVDPAPSWEVTSLERATEAAGGSLARIDGLPVVAVRSQRGEGTARPSTMVRHRLADGRVVWLLEGTEAELAPIHQLLVAGGMTLSRVQRSQADSVASDDGVIRTPRILTIVGSLPKDSLDALAAKVKP